MTATCTRPLPRLRRWALAVLVALTGIMLRGVAQPLLGDELPFVVAFPAVALAALLFGAGPGLMAAALCAAAVVVPWIPPNLAEAQRPVQSGAFLLSSILICLACGPLGRQSRTEPSTITPEAADETPLALWLRAVLWGAFLIPCTAFVLVAWWGYERSFKEGRDGVERAAALVLAHAERSFATARDVAWRAERSAAGATQAELHQRLADMASGLGGVVNISIWDAAGGCVARSDLYPIDPRASIADEVHFAAQRDTSQPMGVSEVRGGRHGGRELLNATIRRQAADGSFAGIVVVSLAPGYFVDYYRALASERPRIASFALMRTDGERLARWPPPPDGRTYVSAASPLLQRVQAGDTSGSLELASVGGRESRLVAFRRIGELPLYVAAGISSEALMADWLRFVGLLAAGIVPITAGLLYVSWVAMKKTRREHAMAVELREQIRRRAGAERAMLETQKLETLAQLTGGVAHDFNNLLSIISNSLHVHRRLHPALAGERQIEAMSRAIQSGVRLTRQLLSFSRKQALRPETVTLQDWLPATEHLVRSTLGRGVQLKIHVEPATCPITIDPAELELAIINTALNAQHAMPDGGVLRIDACNVPHPSAHARTMVVIRVSDSGRGIPPEHLARVFEPFFTTKAHGSGSGLGLSQVHGLCAQAGGLAMIESRPGLGTTVSMYFPAATGPGAQLRIEQGLAEARLQGHVLLVEDNDEVAAATAQLLRTAGLRVTRVADAATALEHLSRPGERPDAVLSDIAMPGAMDGIALAFALRNQEPPTPVLLTTGYAKQLNEAIAGGLRVLSKPATPEEILSELRAMLEPEARAPAPPATSTGAGAPSVGLQSA
jgi:two-component system NtrC family sensor kinase